MVRCQRPALATVPLPYPPNAMRLTAHGEAGVVYENTYYSVGGGFVVDEAQTQSGMATEAEVELPYPFETSTELLAQCRRRGLRISELMLANESAWRSEADTRAATACSASCRPRWSPACANAAGVSTHRRWRRALYVRLGYPARQCGRPARGRACARGGLTGGAQTRGDGGAAHGGVRMIRALVIA